jgi:carbamate kinase
MRVRPRIVLAIGGNALLRANEGVTGLNQKNNIRRVCEAISKISARVDLVVTFGNAPQVGFLASQQQANDFDLSVLDAETQGMIGFELVLELRNVLKRSDVVSVLTQVLVDRNDAAFNKPTKPIGPWFAKMESGLAEIEGRFRRVVPSPKPVK